MRTVSTVLFLLIGVFLLLGCQSGMPFMGDGSSPDTREAAPQEPPPAEVEDAPEEVEGPPRQELDGARYRIEHRMRISKGTKRWDMIWGVLFAPVFLAIYVIAGFDAVRFEWSAMPAGFWPVGLVIFLPAAIDPEMDEGRGRPLAGTDVGRDLMLHRWQAFQVHRDGYGVLRQ